MRLIVFVCALACIGLVSAQATQLEILQSWNLARQQPAIFANLISNFYTGKDGISGDETCYKDAIVALKAQVALKPLSEDVGLDLAGFDHALDLLKSVKKLDHSGSDNSKPEDRLKRYGYFYGAYKFYELLAYTKQTEPVSANKVIMMMLADCGVKDRLHRKIIFDAEATHFGAGVAYAEQETYFVLFASKGYTRKALENTLLDKARIQGDGLYTGNGVSQDVAKWRDASEFVHSGAQIHTEVKIESMDDSNGDLRDLVDDKSVKCPDFINYNILGKRIVRPWTITSRKCTRGTGAFSATTNLDHVLAFSIRGKCFQRLSFCDTKGRVWVLDREYKTLTEYNPQAAPQTSTLGAATDDLSIACPSWINPSLRKRIVQDWYMTGSTCTRGQNSFTDAGFFRVAPFAKSGKCYQRIVFCDEKGLVWNRDSEYKTYAEYQATK